MSKAFDILKKYKIKAVKSLGQNFLIDENVLDDIADTADISRSDIIIEIGAGIGNLTMRLAAKAWKVIAVEIDRKLMPVLEGVLAGFENVDIVNQDIMKVDIKSITGDIPEGTQIKVVANLPYYITTPVIMKLLENETTIDSMVLMMQKEVAERITAQPGNKQYGALTVSTNYYSMPVKIMDVPPESFVPRPNVYSSILKLEIRKEPPFEILNKKFFFNTVKAAFGQRRKKLVNALSNTGNFKIEKEAIAKILQDMGIDVNARGETLSPMQFAILSNSLFQNYY